ncbi:MAG TPA: hypothetical protein VEL74_00505 [Thermoanaerobaculia bacterium]|nr:hypothetical protein [Thermoanaerobaculia bacterium]
MSTTRTLGILLVALAAGACTPPSPGPATGGDGSTESAQAGPGPARIGAPRTDAPETRAGADLRGTITQTSAVEPGGPGAPALGRVLVEGEVEPDTRYDRGWITVTEETRIVRREGMSDRPPSFLDLTVGLRVEVTFEGAVAKSLPLQATAREIVILGAAPAPGPGEEDGKTAGGEAADFKGTAGIIDKPRPDLPPATLRDVRTARQAGFDRVVFEFAGGALPGYHLEYIDKPVRQCGSGEPVPLAGDAWLQVRLVPAYAHTDAGQATVQERERHLDYPVLRELESTCDFEAHVEWVLGVASPNRYRVLELSDPTRLVVDVRH